MRSVGGLNLSPKPPRNGFSSATTAMVSTPRRPTSAIVGGLETYIVNLGCLGSSSWD